MRLTSPVSGPVSQYPPGTDRGIVGTCSKPINSRAPKARGRVGPTVRRWGALATAGCHSRQRHRCRFTFVNAAGTTIPYSADAGAVPALPVVLRDGFPRLRTADPAPDQADHCQQGDARSGRAGGGTTVGTDASANFAIEPDTITVRATKTCSPTTPATGPPTARSWRRGLRRHDDPQREEHVSGTGQDDGDRRAVHFRAAGLREDRRGRGRFTWPNGTTSATLTVVCRSGANPPPVVYQRQGAPATVDITNFGCAAGVFPASVRLSYLGQDQTGDGTIVPTASRPMDLHRRCRRSHHPRPARQLFRWHRHHPAELQLGRRGVQDGDSGERQQRGRQCGSRARPG